jgi:hypothetical protein
MIHELREYKLKPGTLDAYLGHVHSKVARLRGDDFGRLVAFFVTGSGDLERVIHIWEYESLDARQQARAALTRNAGWINEFIANVWSIIEYQQVTFLEVLEQSTDELLATPGQYFLRRCNAATGRASIASDLMKSCQVVGGMSACRYLSIAPDGNAALDLVRVEAQVPAFHLADANAQLLITFTGQQARSIHIDLLHPVAISPFK